MVLLAACHEPRVAKPEGQEPAGEPEETRYAPTFVEPSDDEETLTTTHAQALELELKFAYVGFTELLIDGTSVGTLAELNPIGSIARLPEQEQDHARLSLRFDGGLFPGTHSLQLFTPGTVRELYSQPITIEVIPAPAPVPTVVLAPDTVTSGVDLKVQGQGEDAVLLVIDPQVHGTVRVSLLGARENMWDGTDVRSVALAGHVHRDDGFGPRVAAIRTTREQHDSLAGTFTLAWEVGSDETRIDYAMLVAGEATGLSDPQSAIVLDPALVETVEWASLGRPTFVGRTLVAVLEHYADVEQPHPGDRTLAWTSISGDSHAEPKSHTFVTTPKLDIDLLGQAFVPGTIGMSHVGSAALRVSGREPALLMHDDAAGVPRLVMEHAAVSLAALSSLHRSFVMLVGALGSRFAVGVERDASLMVLAWDASGENGVSTWEFAAGERIPERTPSGTLTVGVVGGHGVVLVPYGSTPDDHDVHMLVLSTSPPTVAPIEGLRCDRVALVPTNAGNALAELGLACLSAGSLELGTLTMVG